MSHNVKNRRTRQSLARTTVVRARVSSDLKNDVEIVLNCLGMTMSDAINMYLFQIRLKNGIPFEIKIPNAETAQEIREARKGKGVVVCKTAEDMFEKLGI